MIPVVAAVKAIIKIRPISAQRVPGN